MIALPFIFRVVEGADPYQTYRTRYEKFLRFQKGLFSKRPPRGRATRDSKGSEVYEIVIVFTDPMYEVFTPLFSKRPPRGRATRDSKGSEVYENVVVFTDPMYEVFTPLFSKSGRGSVAKPLTACAVGVKRASVFFSAPSDEGAGLALRKLGVFFFEFISKKTPSF